MKIEYIGPWADCSGYGNFAKNFIVAMHKAGMDVQVVQNSFDSQRPNLGEDGEICKRLISDNRAAADISILNMTPEFFEKFKNPYAINIGFTMFETNRIPDLWVRECNKLTAIFVPCQWNVEVFKQSGVTVPIYSIPPGINTEMYKRTEPQYELNGISDIDFKFYSIFQWTPRKNPDGLLHAYWAEFTGQNDVCLVLKTYGSNTSVQEQNRVKSVIAQLKYDQKLSHYPRIALIGSLLSLNEIKDVHLNCDCFVLPHRAEGFGLPHMEAMAYGNPVISTNFSGNTEFMDNDNSLLIDYQLTPVFGQRWSPWYEGDMMWAEPNLAQLREKMRFAYENREKVKELGLEGQAHIFKNFDWNSRIDNMRKILDKIFTGE